MKCPDALGKESKNTESIDKFMKVYMGLLF